MCSVSTNEGTQTTYPDVSYGPQPPPVNPDGLTVFYYAYSLPLYVFAVSILLVVGGSLDTDFVAHYSDVLNAAVGVLTSRYQQILGGIRLIPNPSSLVGTTVGIGVPCGTIGVSAMEPDPDTGLPTRACIEYGAIEVYSGYSSVSWDYCITYVKSVSDGDVNYIAPPGAYPKFLLRQLKRKKDVYVGVGLRNVLQAINDLNRLLGKPIVPDALGDWSLREVLGLSQLPSIGGSRSLRALASFIIQTEPLDTPYSGTTGTVSVRTLLNSVPSS
jgi:hypothetical protein